MCDFNTMLRNEYAELVKSLRICGDWKQEVRLAGSDRCEGCKYRVDGDCKSFKGDTELLLAEAADAIEELQKNRVCRIVEKDGETELFIENRWIPVTEKMPERNKWVLAYCKYKGHVIDYVDINGLWSYGNVTHWQPLPEPPKEETE